MLAFCPIACRCSAAGAIAPLHRYKPQSTLFANKMLELSQRFNGEAILNLLPPSV
ncbi:hypothetical protein [Microcoleus sp. herbarium12]|uniref:hypothetical protein n=1 Tax=Microcoleus sp. herbarium12 TaxID=3055437 RepID=UPI002FCF5258